MNDPNCVHDAGDEDDGAMESRALKRHSSTVMDRRMLSEEDEIKREAEEEDGA